MRNNLANNRGNWRCGCDEAIIQHSGHGLCQSHYSVLRSVDRPVRFRGQRPPSMQPALCHPDRPLVAKGQCRPCYQRDYNVAHGITRTPEQRAIDHEAAVIRKQENTVAIMRRKTPKPVSYRWVDDAAGTCVYVGRGSITRAKAHKTASPWWREDLRLIVKEWPTEWHAMEAEGRWGRLYKPTENKEGYRYNR